MTDLAAIECLAILRSHIFSSNIVKCRCGLKEQEIYMLPKSNGHKNYILVHAADDKHQNSAYIVVHLNGYVYLSLDCGIYDICESIIKKEEQYGNK